MNKKVLGITVVLLTVAMLAIPMVGAVGVRRNMSQTFTATVRMADPTTDPAGYIIPGTVTYVGPKDSDVEFNPANPDNRKYQKSSGITYFGVISSDQLGEGTMTSTLILGMMNLEMGVGSGVFKWKWEFDNSICKGTIEGIYKGKQTLTGFPTMTIEGTALLCKGTGDLQNVKIEVTSYSGTFNILTATTLGFSATVEGTMWG